MALRHRFRFVILCVAYVLVPTALVFLQPDLGTALVFGAILITMLVVWGIRLPHLGILAGAGVFAAVLVLRILPSAFGIHLLKDYQLQRLTVFLDPERDPTGAGYQLTQSKIAIGSGMFTGKGYLEGTQTHLNFLPEHHTDFIFAVIGEELGFMGGVLLLGLFARHRVAGLPHRPPVARTCTGTLIATGIAGVLVFQVFVNIGMTIGIMPVTGIPLPFVSFGSSSLVVFLMAIGLLESVHVHSVAGRARVAAPGARSGEAGSGQAAFEPHEDPRARCEKRPRPRTSRRPSRWRATRPSSSGLARSSRREAPSRPSPLGTRSPGRPPFAAGSGELLVVFVAAGAGGGGRGLPRPHRVAQVGRSWRSTRARARGPEPA